MTLALPPDEGSAVNKLLVRLHRLYAQVYVRRSISTLLGNEGYGNAHVPPVYIYVEQSDTANAASMD